MRWKRVSAKSGIRTLSKRESGRFPLGSQRYWCGIFWCEREEVKGGGEKGELIEMNEDRVNKEQFQRTVEKSARKLRMKDESRSRKTSPRTSVPAHL